MTTARMRKAGHTTNWITASVLMLVIGSFGLFADARVQANELPPLDINTSSTSTAPDICVLCTQYIINLYRTRHLRSLHSVI